MRFTIELSFTVFLLLLTVASSLEPNDENFIIGGRQSGPEEHPFFVQPFFYDAERRRSVCGGSLVAPDVVLTAAHCIKAYSGTGGVLVGAVKSRDSSVGNAQWRKVLERYPHPDYEFGIDSSQDDLMLIKIESVTTNIKPIELNFDERVPVDNGPLRVIGFGATRSRLDKTSPLSDELLQVDVSSVSSDQCVAAYQELTNWCLWSGAPSYVCERLGVNPNSMICTIGEEKGACSGDSGGPVIDFSSPTQLKLVGVVSSGRPDCNQKEFFPQVGGPSTYIPQVHVRISAYSDWLKENICELTDAKLNMCGTSTKISMPQSSAVRCKKRGSRCYKKRNNSNNCCSKNLVCSKIRASDPFPRCRTKRKINRSCSKAAKPCGHAKPLCCSGLKCRKRRLRRKGKTLIVKRCGR